MYLPLQQLYVPSVTIATRAKDGRRLDREVRALVADMNPNLPVLSSHTLAEAMSFGFVLQRGAAVMSSALGVVALVLAAIGIYGLVAFTVADRTREIGVRIALGARNRQIVGFVVGGAARLTFVGCAIGVAFTLLAHATLARLLSGFPGLDLLALIAALAVFTIVALTASYGPVRRALALDPIATLRHE